VSRDGTGELRGIAHELVSHAIDSPDQCWSSSVVANRFAGFRNRLSDPCGLGGLARPDPFDQFVSSHDMWTPQNEVPEKCENPRLDRVKRTVNGNCLLQVVDDISPEAKTIVTGVISWIFHLRIWLPGV
jgi:hypothetical protein